MAEDLQRLEDWLVPLLANLQPAEVRQLAREVARRVRQSNQQTMAAQQGPDGDAWSPRKNRSRDARGGLRQGPLFRKLRTAKHLRAQVQGHDAVVQFMGRAERLARIHHFGLRDRVSAKGAEYSYPARPLIGISEAQLGQLHELMLEHIARGY